MKGWGALWGGVALVVALGSTSWGQEVPPWKGNVELSYLKTGGNTASQSFLVAGKVERGFARSKAIGEGRALYGESNDVTSDKSWWTRLKFDQYVNERLFAYLSEEAERDVLKGIEIRYTTQTGIGYDVIKTQADLLKGEIGLGYIRENPIAPLDDLGYATARAFAEYGHAFNETTRFSQTVEYLPSLREGEDYGLKEETVLIANLMASLAFKVSYAVVYDNLPQPGFFKTDRLLKTSLLYTF